MAAAAPIAIATTNICFGAAIALFARDWRAGRRAPRATPIDGAVLAWAAAAVLAACVSIDPARSFRDLRSLGLWGIAYLLAWGIGSGAPVGPILAAWLAGGALACVQGILQATIGFDLLGHPTDHVTGFFTGHLQFGHSCAVLLGVALAVLAIGEGRARPLAAGTAALLAVGLVLSGGRGPWLAFVAIALAGALVTRSWKTLAVLVGVGLLQVGWLAQRPEGLAGYYRSYVVVEPGDPFDVSAERVHSNLFRLTMWREGLRVYAERPIAGTGVETTGELSRDFRTWQEDFGVAHLHSIYFEILMTRGFVGLASLFLLLVTAWQTLAAALPRARGLERAAVFAGMAGVLAHAVHGLTQFTVGSAAIQQGFYVALGIGTGVACRLGVAAPVPRPRLGGAAAALGAVALAFVLDARFRGAPAFSVLAALACADGAWRLRRGTLDAVSASLLAALGFVAGAAAVLFAGMPGGDDLLARVVGRAALPFAVLYAAGRAATAWRGRVSPRRQNSVESPARGR